MSKRVIIILSVLVLIIVVGFLSFNFYVNKQARDRVQLDKDTYYLAAKCFEFCPYKDYQILGENVKKINTECDRVCIRDNLKPLTERTYKESIFESSIRKRYHNLFNEFFARMDFECISKALIGDKSCLFDLVKNAEKFSGAKFIEPIYEEVTIEIEDLVCFDERIILIINLNEGDVDGLELEFVSDYGNSLSIKRPAINQGANRIIIEKSEYTLIIDGNDEIRYVGIGYLKEGDFSLIVSSKFCGRNL